MFLRRPFLAALALCGACLFGTLFLSDVAAAQDHEALASSSAMRGLITPELLQAKAAFQAGNLPRAAALLRSASQHGNAFAEVMLGRMYFEGKGVPQNYNEGLRLITRVVDARQEPATSIAIETLNALKTSVQAHGSRQEKNALIIADLNKVLENPAVQQWLRNSAWNAQHTVWVTCNIFGCW